jgi:hypothetical protein
MFTFTEPPAATLDMAGFYRRHQTTLQRMRRRGWLSEYCSAVEFQTRGALHPHLLAHVPPDLAPVLRPFGTKRRDRAQYRWHFHELVPLARDLGWGPMVDAYLLDSPLDAADYATKRLSTYATKQAYRAFKDAGAGRVRPLRASHGWVPERLRDLQRGAQAVDPGPWDDLNPLRPC